MMFEAFGFTRERPPAVEKTNLSYLRVTSTRFSDYSFGRYFALLFTNSTRVFQASFNPIIAGTPNFGPNRRLHDTNSWARPFGRSSDVFA
jgi:hypothetical protein